MLNIINTALLFILLLFGLNQSIFAQKIDTNNYDNKAQAMAILSAQYSNDCYQYARQNYFSSSFSAIKQNCDSALFCANLAIIYADKAYQEANDSCISAKEIILRAKYFLLKASSSFKQTTLTNLDELDRLLLEDAMYASGNALTDAYLASLEIYSTNNTVEIIETNQRDVTRLESDEFSIVTIKELYGKRQSEISEELKSLETLKNKATSQQKNQINVAMAQLKAEQKELLEKSDNSQNKLVDVRNQLSSEMIKIVNKDMFTTEKSGFYNENVPIPNSSSFPKGLVYRVQIGFFKKQLPSEHFDGVFPVSSQKVEDAYYKYTAGNFSKYIDAKAAKDELRKKGYTGSFVVGFFDGQKLSIGEALKIEQKD